MQNTSKKRVRGRTRFSLRVTAHSRANPLGKVKTCACPLSIFFIGMTHKVFLSSFQLELPQDKFFPPEGWKFEGGWQKKPELRYKNNGINVSLTLLNNWEDFFTEHNDDRSSKWWILSQWNCPLSVFVHEIVNHWFRDGKRRCICTPSY